jgi:pteridine reductase
MSDLNWLFGTAHPVALVTGSGAARIGNVVARTLAERGYRLVIHAHRSLAEAQRTAAEISQSGHEAIALAADIAEESAVKAMVERIRDHFGRIDALVNCAAIWNSCTLEKVTAQDVRRHFEVNTLGTFLCCQRVGLVMVEQPAGGAIVNVGDWAVERPYVDYAAYFASKGAIPALTRTFAVELARRNPRVRVNAVLPGPVMLPPELPAEERQASIRATLAQREGHPEDVADAVRFLIENDYVTGVCLPVDGGRSIYAPL